MRNIIIAIFALLLLVGCNARQAAQEAQKWATVAQQAVIVTEQAVATIREQKATAIAIGLPPEAIERIDAQLARAESELAKARAIADDAVAKAAEAVEAAEFGGWLGLALAAIGAVLGSGVGAAILGPKAALAVRAVHLARAVVAGVESIKAADADNRPLVEDAMRSVMTAEDKAMVREIRAGQI